jgi:hypothetical protein
MDSEGLRQKITRGLCATFLPRPLIPFPDISGQSSICSGHGW